MEHDPNKALAAEVACKLTAFATEMAVALITFMEMYGLMPMLIADGIDQVIFMGMAASFQVREWERLGFFDHMPFHAVHYEQACRRAADPANHRNVEYLKALGLLRDVQRYYLLNFTWVSRYRHHIEYSYAPVKTAQGQSPLWAHSIFAELNPNRFKLQNSPADISAVKATEAVPATSGKRIDSGAWSEAEAADYCGYSVSTLKRMRSNGEIPRNLYRRRGKRGNVRYFIKAFKAWFEQLPKK